MKAPRPYTMHELEDRIHKFLPKDIAETFLCDKIGNPDWLAISSWLLSTGRKLAATNYLAVKKLHFMYHARHASVNINNYNKLPDRVKQYTDHYWDAIQSACIDIWDDHDFLFSLYIHKSNSYALVGQLKVPVFYLSTNINEREFILLPQLQNQLFLQISPTKPCLERRISRLCIYTGDEKDITEVISFTSSTSKELDGFFDVSNIYDVITKTIKLYTYYSNRKAAVSPEVCPEQRYTAAVPRQGYNCFKWESIPRLRASYSHGSPKEHIRKAHLRHYADGKVVEVREAIINRGHETNYFSQETNLAGEKT